MPQGNVREEEDTEEMYDFGLVIMCGCALLFYRIGEMEYSKGIFLAALSVLIWVATHYLLHWRWTPSLCAQGGILVVLTLINCCRGPRD